MPPPYTSVATNRARFTGEALPSPWDSPPSGQGNTMLGAYIPVGYAATSQMQLDDFASKRDDQRTQLSNNYLRRRENENRLRLMPIVTDADIAAENFRKTQAELNRDMANELAEERRQQALLGAQQAKYGLEMLPDKAKLEALETTDRITASQFKDPYQDKLKGMTKDPRHLLIYEDVLQSADPKLPPAARQTKAFNTAAALIQDQPSVEAIESQIMDLPDYEDVRKKLIQDEITPDGRYLGSRVAPTANRAEVNKLIRKHETWKQRKAVSDEQRRDANATMRYLEQEGDNLSFRIRDLEKRMGEVMNPPESDKAELAAAKAALDKITKRKAKVSSIFDDEEADAPPVSQADLKAVPAQQQIAPPTPVPAAQSATPTTSVPQKQEGQTPRYSRAKSWLQKPSPLADSLPAK